MMRITNLADYAVLLCCEVAMYRDRLLSATDLADRTGLPLPTVSKILGMLTRAGVLQSQRGLKGGFSLARDAMDISAAQIIEAIDGPIALTVCVEKAPTDCDYNSICMMKSRWFAINSAVQTALSDVSLEDLVVMPQKELAHQLAASDKSAHQ